MKKSVLFAALALLLLTGCRGDRDAEELESWRRELAAAPKLLFQAELGVQDGELAWALEVEVERDAEGVRLTVTAPETLKGVSVRTTPASASLEYDGASLLLPGGGEERLAPCAAGSILLRALEEGHVLHTGRAGDYRTAALTGPGDETVSIWRDAQGVPVYAEIAREGKTALTLRMTNWSAKE